LRNSFKKTKLLPLTKPKLLKMQYLVSNI